MEDLLETQTSFSMEDVAGIPLGSLSIRVFVLPPKAKKVEARTAANDDVPLDWEAEDLVSSRGASPLGSYLESSKGGKRACVFLINGQRQDFLDNTFIVHDLGFKYLRNRMMIVVECDQLSQDAIGRLMQGSRQGFYRGDVWNSIVRRLVSSLKGDPDLLRLEEEAEEHLSKLEAGDEKVRQTLDQLINSHHEAGLHVLEGIGAAGQSVGESSGLSATSNTASVYLARPELGADADYPVLTSQPAGSILIHPNESRAVVVTSVPPSDWPAISSFEAQSDGDHPELSVTSDVKGDHATLQVAFREPADFDPDAYPIRTHVHVRATFNGLAEPRDLRLAVTVRPAHERPAPELFPVPTMLKITSPEPVKLRLGSVASHVRFRWDGLDSLLLGPNPQWRLAARLRTEARTPPSLTFSEARGGRFGLLVSPGENWSRGEWLEFEVVATGPQDQTLTVAFIAEVVEAAVVGEPYEPRRIERDVPTGSNRRPPYDLVYITRARYDEIPCWAAQWWTDEDPACFLPPTDSQPLRLIINQDHLELESYKATLMRAGRVEAEIERRMTKYTSHVAFHLYQMHQHSVARPDDSDAAEESRRDEIKRVATTLLTLMEVSR